MARFFDGLRLGMVAIVAGSSLGFGVVSFLNVNSSVAQTTVPKVAQNTIPKSSLGLPGWFGFATVSKQNNQNSKQRFSWSPSHPKAQVVIMESGWEKVKPKTNLMIIGPNIKQTASFQGVSNQPYGCDGSPKTMAGFSSGRSFPEGMVFITSGSEGAKIAGLVVSEVPVGQIPRSLLSKPNPKSSEVKAWKVGSSMVILNQVAPYKVNLMVANGSKVLYKKTQEKYFMEGAEKKPVNLNDSFQPGISRPIAGFQFKPNEPPAIVLWNQGYEGNSFVVLTNRSGVMKDLEIASLYYCAF